jgi:ABC-type branched-subunit amino acid transport system substrate-binding protein
MTLRSVVLAACVLVVLALAAPVQAQITEPPLRSEEARATFEQGLDAFDEGDYGMAYRRFRLVFEVYPLNRQTTAALLMAGRALYRQAAYAEAIDLLTRFIDQYPTSSYTGAARSTIRRAREALERQDRLQRRIRLGIALPMTPRESAFSQALFNGIRLVVDAFNADTTQEYTVQMVFAETENAPEPTRRAVMRLAQEDSVDAIIGPLFSEEARAAARAAEEQQVVLVAPLATEDDVSAGRRYTFQANPTIGMRGRVMAEFAIRDMRLASFGLLAEEGTNSISERMAEGFQEEALRLGADVAFYEWLQERREWASLLDVVGPDTIRGIEALYMPIDGRSAAQLAEGALRSLDQAGVYPRVLGNTRWSDLRDADLASRFYVTYTTEYYLDEDDEAVQTFQDRYEVLARETPDRLAYVGHDVAQYLLQHLVEQRQTGTPLVDVLQTAPRYEGLATRIDFGRSNVNQAMFILTYRNGERRLLR